MTQAVTTPAKSLGEKLFEARRSTEMTAIPRWSDLMDHEQEAHEKAALAFAASLSHDETANAVITDLRQRLQAAEERAEKAEIDLAVIHRAAQHCCGRFGGRMSEIDRIFQEITRISSMHKTRAALKTEGA